MARDLFATNQPKDLFSDYVAAPIAKQATNDLDKTKSFFSQMGRQFPEGLDLAGSAIDATANYAMGGSGDYFNGFMQPRYTPFSDAVDSVVGPKYEPKTTGGHAFQIAGGLVGPSEILGITKGVANTVGLGKGIMGSMEGYIKDPQALMDTYHSWKGGLENVPVTSGELQSGLLNPVMQGLGHDAKYLTKDGAAKLNQTKQLAQRDTTLGDVYALRKSLRNVDDSSAVEPIRDATKAFIGDRVGTEGLDAYRRAMTFEDVNKALRNVDNEGIKATRTKINNLDTDGMTDIELAAKENAGRAGIGEGILRGFGNKVLPASVALGPVGFALGLAGKGVAKGADYIAKNKFDELQQVLLNKRAAPNAGEKLGGLLNKGGRKFGKMTGLLK